MLVRMCDKCKRIVNVPFCPDCGAPTTPININPDWLKQFEAERKPLTQEEALALDYGD